MARSRGPVTVDISALGDVRLQKRLARLTTKMQKSIVRRALRAGAKEILAVTKQLVPVDTGKLREGLKIRATKARRGSFGVQVQTPTRADLGIGADEKGFYPAVLEYGADGHPPHPYLRPALEQGRAAALDAIATGIREGIDEAVK